MTDMLITVGSHMGTIFLLVLLVALVGGQRLNWPALIAAFAAFAVYITAVFFGDAVLQVPELKVLKDLAAQSNWNWTGKIVALCSTLVMAVAVSLVIPGALSKMGFTLRQTPGSVPPALAMATAVIGGCIAMEITLNDGREVSTDRLLYQSIMPGLDEEPLFRGLLPFLLALGLGGNEKRIWYIGTGGFLATVLFGVGHGLAYQEGAFVFASIPIVVTGLIGLSLLWIRERTGSLLLPIIVHNVINVSMGFF